MEVDWEAAWLSLKAEIVKKRSHGARDLALRMAEIEVDNRVPSGQEGYDPAPARPPTVAPLARANGHG